MKYLITTILAFAIATIMQAQDKNEMNVQQMLESKNFVFQAESVTPSRGRLRQLTTEYDVVVKGDTVISFLPYFGRAYSAPIDPSEGGIKFTSSKNDYSIKKGKKQRWEVTIKPLDTKDVQDLYLTVFDNGQATLRVNSISRESISFNGYVKQGKQEDKKAF